jgi:hypothetical protein
MGKASARRDVPPMRRRAPLEDRRVVRNLPLGRLLFPVPEAFRSGVRDLRASRQRRRAEASRRGYLRRAEIASQSLAYLRAEAEAMSVDPMAQAQVESEIHRMSHRLTQVTEDIARLSQRAAQAEVDYKVGFAKALYKRVGSKMSVGLKEAAALIEMEEEFGAMKLLDAELKALQEAGRNLRSQLDSLRSINANVRGVVANS